MFKCKKLGFLAGAVALVAGGVVAAPAFAADELYFEYHYYPAEKITAAPMGVQPFKVDPAKHAQMSYNFGVITPAAPAGCHYEAKTGATGQKIDESAGTLNSGKTPADAKVIAVSFKTVCADQKYSINYKYNGKTLSSQTGSATVGTKVAYKLPDCKEAKFCHFEAEDGSTAATIVYNQTNYDVNLKVVMPAPHKYVFHYKTAVGKEVKTLLETEAMLRIGEKHEFANDLADVECPFDNCKWVAVDGRKFYEAPYADKGEHVTVMVKAVPAGTDSKDHYTKVNGKDSKKGAAAKAGKAKAGEAKVSGKKGADANVANNAVASSGKLAVTGSVATVAALLSAFAVLAGGAFLAIRRHKN